MLGRSDTEPVRGDIVGRFVRGGGMCGRFGECLRFVCAAARKIAAPRCE